MVHTVVVTAATGPLGRRVCQRVAADPAVDRLVAIDRPRPGRGPDGPIVDDGESAATPSRPAIELHIRDLDDPSVGQLCRGATAVIHLGSAAVDGAGGPGDADVAGTRALLTAASDAGVPTLVVLSSAMVYGAWPGNPVPLTEAAPLRPVPGLPFAVRTAEIERLVADWRTGDAADARTGTAAGDAGTGSAVGPDGEAPAVTAAVLRPVVPVGPGLEPWLGRSWSAAGPGLEAEPPAQFVHLDDLAAAVDLARRDRLDGPFNVAPDGWLSAADRRGLAGPVPRVRVPAPVAERIASVRWRFGLTGVPPSVLAYSTYPWVVANDRLRAAGWRPAHTNEEALVDAEPAGPLARVHPRRRQLLSLAALALPVLGLAAGAIVLVRRLRDRHR